FPFGEPWQTNNDTGNDQKFTTYDRESVSNLDYAMARIYTNRYGRFMSPDPVLGDPANPQSWNRYTYGLNDPINNIDPSGETCINNIDENGKYCIGVDVNSSAPST